MSGPESDGPDRGTPDTMDDVPPDRDTMFPTLNAKKVEQKQDASVGIVDPRKETDGPEAVSAPVGDD